MNKEKIKIYTENLIASIREEMDPVHVCPLCEKPVSVIDEIEHIVKLECINHKCPIMEYTVDIDV